MLVIGCTERSSGGSMLAKVWWIRDDGEGGGSTARLGPSEIGRCSHIGTQTSMWRTYSCRCSCSKNHPTHSFRLDREPLTLT